MADPILTAEELKEVEKYFGPFADLDLEGFKKTRKELQVKYHPDKFAKFEDETVKELATERFQRIEALSHKLELLLDKKYNLEEGIADIQQEKARFAFDKMQIEIITRNKDLKYHLFGSRYRWLERGESYSIPKTKAKIVIDEDHQGNSIGFNETIRLFVSFGQSDPIEFISLWLYQKLEGRASALIIEGKRLSIDLIQINHAIKRTSFIGIEG
ncbi:MAG: hypothetical protein AAF694_27475 [Bacteroidota bacterium]